MPGHIIYHRKLGHVPRSPLHIKLDIEYLVVLFFDVGPYARKPCTWRIHTLADELRQLCALDFGLFKTLGSLLTDRDYGHCCECCGFRLALAIPFGIPAITCRCPSEAHF